MGKLLFPISIVLAASAMMFLPGWIRRTRLEDLIDSPKLAKWLGYLKFKALIDPCRRSEWIDRLKCTSLLSRLRLSNLVQGIKLDDWIGPEGFSVWIRRTKSRILRGAGRDGSAEYSEQLDLSVLNCRVQLTKQEKDDGVDAFKVEICGAVRAPSGPPEERCISLRISILDVTDGVPKAKPVCPRAKQWSASGAADSSTFCYNAELGKLPHQVTTLSNWTAIARIRLDWLAFPRKGRRNLQFSTSVLSSGSGQELAWVKCPFTYENPDFGYIDLHENIQRTKVLAVALAFVVSTADNKLHDCEVELIRKWAKDNIFDGSERASDKACRKLDKALNETVAFFHEGNRLNAYEICREIVEIVPVGQRYDVLDLCLHAAQANGTVAAEQLAILKKLAIWLEVDAERFRTMMEKALQIGMHEVRDVEAILGITSDMSKENARQRLNKEYGKWISRVTNADPDIQTQADQMLKLIAEARSQYVEEQPVLQKDDEVPIQQDTLNSSS